MDQVHIVTYPQRIGDTSYLTADLIDIQESISRGLLNERLIGKMKEQGKIAEMTPDSFRTAVSRRPEGAPWPPRGFTEAYLVERGFVTAPEAPPSPPEPKASKVKGAKPGVVIVSRVDRTVEAIQVGDYWLQPKKRGHFTFWDAIKEDGSLLRAKSFKTVEAGTTFLETLST